MPRDERVMQNTRIYRFLPTLVFEAIYFCRYLIICLPIFFEIFLLTNMRFDMSITQNDSNNLLKSGAKTSSFSDYKVSLTVSDVDCERKVIGPLLQPFLGYFFISLHQLYHHYLHLGYR